MQGGDDETKTVVSAEPGGDLNAAEKGEVKAEGSMLLNEDRVKYHNDNGEGAAEWNSVLKDVRELWTRGIQRIMKTREPTVSSGLPALDDKTF
ncbi:unnamed protein product [Coregonus sp. 'balchen']|nr:unnamed protein product [Coregonus sp. 'balchen']